jgi:hypothetical protein
MRNSILYLFILLTVPALLHSQENVGIGTQHPDESAVLDVYSTDKGMLLPRMGSMERMAIPNPATGLLVYDDDQNTLYQYNGTNWERVGSKWSEANNKIYYNEGNVGIGTDDPTSPLTIFGHSTGALEIKHSGGSVASLRAWNTGSTTFFGTTSNHPLNIITTGATRIRIDNAGRIGIGVNSGLTERLHVNGAIVVGQNNENIPGAIRFADDKFEGYNGQEWQDLSAVGSGMWQENGDDIYYNEGNVSIGTDSAVAQLHVEGLGDGQGSVVFVGEQKWEPDPYGPPVEGPGTRFIWYPDYASLRAGKVTGNQWDETNFGQISNAWGLDNTASGYLSTAWGQGTSATQNGATSWGENNLSSGINSTSWGNENISSATSSTTWGSGNLASATHSTAWGQNNTATGTNSTAWGENNAAVGNNSSSIGIMNSTLGQNSIAIGRGLNVPSLDEVALGRFGTIYTPIGGSDEFELFDRIFSIGVGADEDNRRDAIIVNKSGMIGIDREPGFSTFSLKSIGNCESPPYEILPPSGEFRAAMQIRRECSGYGLVVHTPDDYGTPIRAIAEGLNGLKGAIRGESKSSSGQTVGVYGEAQSNEGIGVEGINISDSGLAIGVRGESNFSPEGVGVYGNSTPGTGVHGHSFYGTGVFGNSACVILEDEGNSCVESYGVHGKAARGTGVFGEAYDFGSIGVKGESSGGYGVYGKTNFLNSAGIYGTSNIGSSPGVYGINTNNSSNNSIGVRGHVNSPSGYSGYFTGAQGSKFYIQNNLGIGTTSPGMYKMHLQHGTFGLKIQNSQQANSHWEFWHTGENSNTLRLFTANGGVGHFDYNSGEYSHTSDIRLKENISNLASVMPRLLELNSKTYSYKADPSKKNYFGFIAQEVEKIFPELVISGNDDADRQAPYHLSYSGFAVLAIKGIQEQQVVIDDLQSKYNDLKSENEKLKMDMESLEKEYSDKFTALYMEIEQIKNILKE